MSEDTFSASAYERRNSRIEIEMRIKLKVKVKNALMTKHITQKVPIRALGCKYT